MNELLVKGYFSSSIRGKKGDKATPEEINFNLAEGTRVGTVIQKKFGELLDLYIPHAHDTLIQKLWKAGKLESEDILEGDSKIIYEKDVLIVYAPEKFFSNGMLYELRFATLKNIKTFIFEKLSNKVYWDIYDVIYDILNSRRNQ